MMELTADLRVLEITNPVDPDAPKPTSKQSGRQAGHPFARGHGGTAISEVVNFWKGSWAIGKGVNDVDWGVSSEWYPSWPDRSQTLKTRS